MKSLRLSALGRRTFEVLPILLAIVFHAFAMERWILVAPAAIAVVYGMIRSNSVSTIAKSTSRWWYVVVIVGLILGLIIPASDSSGGLLPPTAAAALTGVAVCVCVFTVMTGQTNLGWVAAWALVSISGNRDMIGSIGILLIGFLAASLIATSMRERVFKHRIGDVAIWSAFVMTIVSATWLISIGITRVEELFLGTIESFVTNPSKNVTTGIGDSLTVGSKSNMNPSRQPLLELSQKSGPLRVKVMDVFENNQWTASLKFRQQRLELDRSLDPTQRSQSIEILFLESLDTSIPTPSGTLDIQNSTAKAEGGWIWRGRPDAVAVTIRVDSLEQLPRERADEVDLLDVPDEIQDAIASLTIPVVGDASRTGSTLDQAKSIESFFRENFEYSLATDLSGDAHPIVTLIRQRRPAYCTYFATAMALMLRTRGIPTRVVTGFVADETNSITGRVTVRSSDAHAWVEVWSTEDHRFVAFDPTPSDSRQRVMGHNDTAGIIASAVSALRSSARRLWMLIRYQPSSGIRAILVSPLIWFGVIVMIWLWRKRSGRFVAKIPGVIPTSIDKRLQKQYEQYLATLKAAGVEAGFAETDDELLARLRETGDAALWESANRFIHHYRAVRYGGEPVEELLSFAEDRHK
jgi:protein-glutamine gamma-glutamyltransferase